MPPPMRHRSMRVFMNDDRHVMAKHSVIYPTQEELENVQNMVSHTERALKAVSDWLDKQEKGTSKSDSDSAETDKESEHRDQATRSLRGVMRVGLVAKGLLLKGDLDLELVLLCKEKPTINLLKKVSENLVTQLKTITEEKYVVTQHIREASIVIKNAKEPPLTLTIHLTSPLVREEIERAASGDSLSVNDPPDVLDRQKCLTALASLRHAKWFQARANGLRSCVIVIRILRDLCARVPTWASLRGWPLELICEKAIGTGNRPMGAGEALRRVLECLASGILMPDCAGISDPCEKEPTDAIGHLDHQQREDITASAQHALRLSAFGQLHKVLGMDPLPSKMPKKPRSETPIDYTVQIPPSTAYAPPMKRPIEEEEGIDDKSPNKKKKKLQKKSPEEKAEPPQAMNALMRLNQLKPGLQYKLISQTGPVHVPVFTMAVEVDGKTFEASGPSKRTAKLHVAVKVLQDLGLPTGVELKTETPVLRTDLPEHHVPCCYFPDYYNNGGTNGGAGASSSPSGGPPASTAAGSAQGSYGYYQNDAAYAATPAAKTAKKKPPMHKGGKAPFPGPPGVNSGSAGGFQSSSPPGQGSYNQYGQGYGQGKKSFNQNPVGTGGYSYSTAYPSQVTGGGGGSQEYSYEGFNSQSNYNSQGGGTGGGNQGFGTNQSQYHNPVGYGRGDSSMNYQYR
ncbi:interleukin enhancer-binding factor 3 homolog [Sander vitreus]